MTLSNRTEHRKLTPVLLCLVLGGIAGCQEADVAPRPSLLDGYETGAAGDGESVEPDGGARDSDEPPSDDEEAERLRRMQLIKVTTSSGITEWTADALALNTYNRCMENEGIWLGAGSLLSTQCRNLYPAVRCNLQTGTWLMELASSAHLPVKVPGNSAQVTPQPVGPRHRLALLAAGYIYRGSAIGLQTLQGEGVSEALMAYGEMNCTNDRCDCATELAADFPIRYQNENGVIVKEYHQTVGSRLIGSAVEAYHLLKEAAALSGELGLAAADAQRSDTGSVVEGMRRQMTAAEVSRTALAHLLVGGDIGLGGSVTPEGLCSVPDLTPSAQRALSLMREAALSPADILNPSLAIEDLVDDDYRIADAGMFATSCGSVRERLYQKWNEESFADTSMTTPERFGLAYGDFLEARDYLKREISIFARSLTATITSGVCNGPDYDPGDPLDAYPSFAGIAGEPTDIDPVYWSTLLRQTSAAHYPNQVFGELPFMSSAAPTDPTNVPTVGFKHGLAGAVEDLIIRSADAARKLAAAATTPALKEEVTGALNLLLADAAKERAGRLYVMRWTNAQYKGLNTTHLTMPLLWGTKSNEGAIVVRGEDGLRCALTGSIEGAPCDAAQLTALTAGALNKDYRAELTAVFAERFVLPPAGAATLANLMMSRMSEEAALGVINTAGIETYTRLYIVKPRPGEIAGAGPGEYVAVTGFRHLTTGTAAQAGRDVAVWVDRADVDVYSLVPELEKTATAYIEPNRRWCGHAQLTCADTTFDERLALETELTEGTAAKEDSWRHYLTLARQAADEADVLGQTYLQSEIDRLSLKLDEVKTDDQIRERRERELEELQNICGTSIETEKLFKLFAPFGDIRKAAPLSCATPAEAAACSSTHNGRCFGNLCISDMDALLNSVSSDPDLYRLAQCWGATGSTAIATAGDQKLCVTYAQGNRNRICEVSSGKLKSSDCPISLGTTGQGVTADDRSRCEALFDSVTGPADTTDVAIPLDYFKIDKTTGDKSSVNPVQACHAFRRARVNAELGVGLPGQFDTQIAQDALSAMRDDIYFFENVQHAAKHIGWSAEASSFGTTMPRGSLQYRGASVYPAIRVEMGMPTPAWPCAGQYASASVRQSCIDSTRSGYGNNSFFCQQLDCSSAVARGQWDNRSFWAAVTLRAMAYRGVPSEIDIADEAYPPKFSEVDPMAGISVLAYGPRNTSFSEQLNFFPSEKTNPWTANHYLASQRVQIVDYEEYDNEYVNLEIFQTANNGTPLAGQDVYSWYPNGAPIATHGIDNSILRLEHGTFDDVNLRVFNKCRKLTPAPFWWGRLGMTNRIPWIGPDKHPNFAEGGYPTDAWVYSYLATNTAKYRVPTHLLWGTAVGDGCVAGVQSSNALLSAQRGFEINGQTVSPGSFPMAIHAAPATEADRVTAVLDAVELYCHFQLEYQQPPEVALTSPPQFDDIDDLDDVAEYFRQVALTLNNTAAKLVFANLPAQAIDALALNPVNSAYPALGGELAASILSLRGALIQLSGSAPKLATEIELLSSDMRSLQSEIKVLDIERDKLEIKQMAETVQRVSDCVSASMPSVGSGGYTVNTGAVAICANAFAQIAFSGQIGDLEDDVIETQAQLAIERFSKSIAERRDVMRRYADQIREANEIINENLATIDGIKAKARRAVQRAMFMQTELAAAQAELSSAMRARTNVNRERYQRALSNAKKLAFLAKRSIEQRIGMSLSEMREALPLVEAPSSWEARVCSSTGIDFKSFQELSEEGDVASSSLPLDRFADQFVGDYVTKLENLIESYPLYFNFHEGQDTTVISLRDDVLDSKIMCDVPTGNLLFDSGSLGNFVTMMEVDDPLDPGAEGWVLEGCAKQADGRPLRDCIGVSQVLQDTPLPGETGATAQLIRFGDTGAICDYGNVSNAQRCGYTEDSVIRQDVYLQPGRYLLSWYAKASTAASNLMFVRSESGATLSSPAVAVTPAGPGTWQRYFTQFVVSVPGPVSVVLAQPTPSRPATVTVAAAMLEDITRVGNDVTLVPRPYTQNGRTLTRTIPACKDKFGVAFERGWKYHCANLCPNGFGAACDSDAVTTQCYYELAFGLSQREIESGAQLRYAGFAKGNFNYRLESVAVNFVGTGTRNCDSEASSCYSSGSIPYSISHDGPYYVRNHEGENFEAKLFPGWIEHARGLAAERVITNPISSADRELLTDYRRGELQGRPLDGLFTLRVWDEPGVNFNAIEDAQLVLDYSYWTRFD